MGNECCSEREEEGIKTQEIDVLADEGMTPDVSYRSRRECPVAREYWKEFEPTPKKNILKSMLDDWPENGLKVMNEKFIEIEGRRQDQGEDVVPPGLVSWDGGDVREIVRMLFEYHRLPIPPCSVQVWTVLWHRYEHDKKNFIDMMTVCEFGRFFVSNMYALANGDSPKIEVQPNVCVASEDNTVKKGDWQKDFVKHIPAMKQVLEDWDDDHEHETMEHLFANSDVDKSGKLVWNDGEVKGFVLKVFEEHKIPIPKLTESQWYNLYRKFSTNQNKGGGMGMSFDEAEKFAQFVHEEIIAEERIAVDEMGDGVVDVPPAVALKALTGKPLAASTEHAGKAKEKLNNWNSDPVQSAFEQVAAGKSTIQWNGGGIVNFVLAVFEKKNLPKPKVDQATWHTWWMEFDHDHNCEMDPKEAMEFAKFVLERTLQLNGQVIARPVTVVRQERRGVVPISRPATVVMPGQTVRAPVQQVTVVRTAPVVRSVYR